MKKKTSRLILVLACIMNWPVQAAEFDNAGSLKSLFTTPLERQKLDEMRNSGKFSKSGGSDSTGLVRLPLKIDVRGIVIREAGQPVVWVNEGNTLKSEKIEDGVRVRSDYIRKEPVVIPVRVDSKTLKMKPGQQWDERSDKIQDKYQIKEEKSLLNGITE
ncbi:MAG: hypothetical protein EP315_00045 [Gammaproteobacteria bacterium]|nr:MAG: hypothetical protein EP315_00045 [Gammaproteobacteria bacterium]